MNTSMHRLACPALVLALIAGMVSPTMAQTITGVYVFQDNGYYASGGSDFPSDPFANDVIRDVDVAWVRVGTGGTTVPVAVTSSNPSILEVAAGSALNPLVLLRVHEPQAPTQVTITANTIPSTFAKTYSVTVYPPQRVEKIQLVPQKPFYVVGEVVELEVTMRYAEPFPGPGSYFRELRLDFEPAIDNTVYLQTTSTWGAEIGDDPSAVRLPESKSFRIGMKLLRPETNQALKASVMCAITSTRDGWWNGGYDDCYSGTQVTYFKVLEGPRLEKLALADAVVAAGTATTGRLDVSAFDPALSAPITLSSSDPTVTVPATVTPSGSGAGSATFPITTTMAPGNRTVTISATKGEQTINAKLNVQGVLVRDLTVAKPELRAEETFELVVTLDQPAPGPITVTLTSSDPRAVPLPTQVTFSKGEMSKRVSIRAGAATRTTDVRLAGSIAGSPARETAVRISAGDATRLQETSGATRPRTTDR